MDNRWGATGQYERPNWPFGAMAVAAVVLVGAVVFVGMQKAKTAALRAKTRQAEEEARQAEAFYQQWKHMYALVEGKYVHLPDFDLRHQNSRGGKRFPGPSDKPKLTLSPSPWGKNIPIHQWRETLIRRDRQLTKWKKRVFEWEKKKSRHNWETILPHWDVGEFGCTRAGAIEVVQVLGPMKMLVRTRQPDRPHTILFTGWSTQDLVAKQQVEATHVAVIGADTDHTVANGDTVLRAIPLAQVQRGLTQEQFKELLEQKQGNLE